MRMRAMCGRGREGVRVRNEDRNGGEGKADGMTMGTYMRVEVPP